jgi:TPR repeat protein
MAQSYDPEALRKIYIQGGLQPDVERARNWYENAARLGSGDAQRALGALANRVR